MVGVPKTLGRVEGEVRRQRCSAIGTARSSADNQTSTRVEQRPDLHTKSLGELGDVPKGRVPHTPLYAAHVGAIHPCVVREPLLGEPLRLAEDAQATPEGNDGGVGSSAHLWRTMQGCGPTVYGI